MKYGYARVSSKTQDHEGQVEALKAAGCERIVAEKASGKNTSGRPQFERMLKALQPGDTVVVTKLDRLGGAWREISHTKGGGAELGFGVCQPRQGWGAPPTLRSFPLA